MVIRILSFSLVLSLFASLWAGAQDRSTPESTVRAFLTAFGKGDIKQAAAVVKGARVSDEAMTLLWEQIKKEPVTFTLSEVKTTTSGMSATLTGQVTVTSTGDSKPETLATEVTLTSTEGGWLIVPDAARAKESRNPDAVNMLAYMLTDTQVFVRARDAARSTACASNLKQITTGAFMLAQDHDEKLRVRPDSFKKSLSPYVKNDGIFKCPSHSGATASYSFNSALAGAALYKVKLPAQTVMVYEGRGGKLDFRHEGRAAIGFADGHVKLVTAAEAKKLRWKP